MLRAMMLKPSWLEATYEDKDTAIAYNGQYFLAFFLLLLMEASEGAFEIWKLA